MKKTRHERWRQWVEAKWYWNFLEHVCGYVWFVNVWKLIDYLGLSFTHYDGTPLTGSFGLAPLSYWLYLCKTIGTASLVLGIGTLPFAWLIKHKHKESVEHTIVIVEGHRRVKASYRKAILLNTFMYAMVWFVTSLAVLFLMIPVGLILGLGDLSETVIEWVMKYLSIIDL